MPARGYHRRRFKRLAVRQNNAFADIALHEDRIGAGAPFELAAERNDLVADRRNQQRQFIRTDMRMAEITDFAGSSELDERIKNITDAPVADPRVKFAVGPCAGAALAEQEVALLVEFARGVEIINILMAAVHILAPFENDGPASRLSENQRTEKPRGSGTDHDRIQKSVLTLEIRGSVIHFSGSRHQRIDSLGAVLNGCDERVNQFQVRLMAGVDTAFENPVSENIGRLDSASCGNVTLEFMIDRRGQSLDIKRKIFH